MYSSTKSLGGLYELTGGGYLHMMIHKAELSRDTDYLTDMDPYVEVLYKGEVQRTPILHDAGKTPEWNITMNPIAIDSLDDEIKFTVLDKDLLQSEVIGYVSVKVGALCSLDAKKRWLTLKYQGKEAGDFLIETKYIQPEVRDSLQSL